jgi:hypothetical protein
MLARGRSGGRGMNETPERLLVDDADIARLTRLVTELDDEELVRLILDDGRVLEGVVAARPSVQLFRAEDGGFGSNALLRLDPLSGDALPHYLWLDRIADVVRLGSD